MILVSILPTTCRYFSLSSIAIWCGSQRLPAISPLVQPPPAAQSPLPIAAHLTASISSSMSMSTSKPDPTKHQVEDPIPDPEPASPSLDEPDPGVFRHSPPKPAPPKP
ncbi:MULTISPECIES: hypothetical protein [Acidobacteriaceae]|uniref:hypothetical protein n=1 Tax=Acidobacteriaceae TaxID=204434 RepID=UPI001C20A8E6|nr:MULTISPECIES: hypothetical protein [Acidobacteriaceae]MDW5264961.1 hypothetical protein [Edaphobacter sp.]